MKRVMTELKEKKSIFLWAGIIAVTAFCFQLPVLSLKIQERQMEQELEQEKVQAVDLSMYMDNEQMTASRGLSLEEKVDIANVREIMAVYLNEGENYQCSQVEEALFKSMKKIKAACREDNEIIDTVWEIIQLREKESTGNNMADMAVDETTSTQIYVEEQYADVNSQYTDVEINAQLYVNPEQPRETFIAWDVFYYEADHYIEVVMDDETGEILKVAINTFDMWGKVSEDYDKQQEKIKELLKKYYETQS